jgi:hypothetical protein
MGRRKPTRKQSDKYWPIYNVEQVLLTLRTQRQTDKQTALLIPYILKKYILILPQTYLQGQV